MASLLALRGAGEQCRLSPGVQRHGNLRSYWDRGWAFEHDGRAAAGDSRCQDHDVARRQGETLVRPARAFVSRYHRMAYEPQRGGAGGRDCLASTRIYVCVRTSQGPAGVKPWNPRGRNAKPAHQTVAAEV